MSESLWALSAADLLAQTASPAPTPGGGSVAAVCGAVGLGLLQMAVRTADTNILELERLSSALAPALRERRDVLARRLEVLA